MKKNLIALLIFIIVLVLIVTISHPTKIIEVITCIFLALMFVSPVVIGEKLAIRVYNKQSARDIEIEEETYNELLNNYPLYILDKILYNKTKPQSLLLILKELEEKGQIKKDNNQTIVNSDNNNTDTEKYILESLKNKETISLKKLNKALEEELKDRKLHSNENIATKNTVLTKLLVFEIIFVLLNLILELFSLSIFYIEIDKQPLLYSFAMIVLTVPFILLTFIPVYFVRGTTDYTLAKQNLEAHEIYSKLIALNKYIKTNPQEFKKWKNYEKYSYLFKMNSAIYQYYSYTKKIIK